MVKMKENPDLGPVIEELEKMTPLEKLDEKRKWRDDSISRLSKLKQDMDLSHGS